MKVYAIILLCLGMTSVSFVQLVSVNSLAPIIMYEFSITPYIMGMLMALWTVPTVLSPLIGRLVDSLGPIKVGTICLVTMSLASLATACSTDICTLSVARFLFGVFMPLIWPVCAKIVSVYVPREMYSLATSVYNTGSMIGLTLTFIMPGLLAGNWRRVLAAVGLMGFTYTAIYIYFFRDEQGLSTDRAKLTRIQPNRHSLPYRLLALMTLSFFLALYPWGVMVSWTSTFLVRELNLGYEDLIPYMTLIAVLSFLVEIGSGIASDKVGGLKGKKITLITGLLLTGTLLALITVIDRELKPIILFVTLIAYRISTPSFWSIINEVIPSYLIGRFSGIYTLAGPAAGLTASALNGYIIEATGSLEIGFLIASTITFLSALIYSKV